MTARSAILQQALVMDHSIIVQPVSRLPVLIQQFLASHVIMEIIQTLHQPVTHAIARIMQALQIQVILQLICRKLAVTAIRRQTLLRQHSIMH